MTKMAAGWIAGMLVVTAGCGVINDNAKPIAYEKTPVTVKLGIEKAFPDSRVQEVRTVRYEDGSVNYRVRLKTAEGKTVKSEFAPDGEVVEEKD